MKLTNSYLAFNGYHFHTTLQIKDRLLIEDKRIESFELRKNKDNNRKFNKQVKELRKQEGAQSRKANIAEVSNIRKEGGADGSSASKDEKIKKIIDAGPATKSKKRVNMVSSIEFLLYSFWLSANFLKFYFS